MSTRSRTLIALVAGAVFGFSASLTSGVLAEHANASAEVANAATVASAAAAANATTAASAISPAGANPNSAALPWEEARLFAEVYERIKREYVDDVDDHALMDKAIRGMVAALDPHSAFLDTDEFEEIRLSTMGSYPGVGIEVVAEDSAVKILRPIEGSPAEQAGLLSGDQIVRIDDTDIGADLAGAIAHMRGSSGSLVKLTVLRRRPVRRSTSRSVAQRSKCTVWPSRAWNPVMAICELRVSVRRPRMM